jgi:virulence-associated protein VapD
MVGHSLETLICSFCGKRHDEVRRLIAGTGVGRNGAIYEGRLCSECIGTFMLVMALEDREWFDKQVEEARTFKPETGSN